MLVENLTDWTVVIVGQWNPHIFSPEWLTKNLHLQNLEAMIGVTPAAAIDMRYQTPDLLVIPGRDRLIVGVRNEKEETLLQMEKAQRDVLRLLTHTPVRAIGINFGYTENEPPPELIKTFNLDDSGALSDAGFSVSVTEIMRHIDVPPATLKLKMAFVDGIVKFHFNFTQPISSSEEAAELLNGKVLFFRDKATDMLKKVFQLHSEEVIHDGH